MTDQLLQTARGRPTCIAIVICNEVIEDKHTNNKTLVGLFNIISTPQLPCLHPRMFIMASFSEGQGKWPLAVALKSPSGKETLRLEGEINCVDSQDTIDVVVEMRGLPLEEAGVYHLDILLDNSFEKSRRFSVQLQKGAAV